MYQFLFFFNFQMVFSFFRLLDKLPVTCPHADSCEEQLQRGNLDDHLRYRCSGTLVACQFAASGCDYRGPSKSMAKHQTECRFKKEGKIQKTREIKFTQMVIWTISIKDFQKMENIQKNNLRNWLISFEEAFWPELLNFLAHCERLEGLPKRYFHEKSDINKAKCLFTFR